MTYEQARKFIEQTTKFGSILGLTSMKALMQELGNVQNNVPMIHIAGTNGKGSVGAYLASIFKEAGLKVGRYCSPAVFHPLECWQYDGRMINEHEYADIMSQVKKACDIVISKGIQPTVFEVETAAAFVYFSQMPTDIVLLETGLGGETDATNVIEHPLACVFTNISRDHMQFLGETLTEIATVKAGIIKEGAYVCSANQKPEVEEVLKEFYINVNSIKCSKNLGENRGLSKRTCLESENVYCVQDIFKKHSQTIQPIFVQEEQLHLLSQKAGELEFSYKNKVYQTQLSGIYQMKNAALAIEVAENLLPILLRKTEDTQNIIKKGIKKAVWSGRFEVIAKEPLFLIDGAHNEDAAYMLSQTLQNSFTKSSFVYIIGVLADKEHKKMLELMQFFSDKVYTITPPNARGLDAKKLAEEASEFYKEVTACETIEEAVTEAFTYAKEYEKHILAFGSLSYLSEMKTMVEEMLA